jgi:hypothetical protein
MRLISKQLQFLALTLIWIAASTVVAANAGPDSILGKWQVAAQTPDGPLSVEFNFIEQNGVVSGSARVPEGSYPFSSVEFDGTNFAAGLSIHGDLYNLTAVLKDGKLVGAFERTDGAVKGTWTGELIVAVAGAGVSGTWDTIAVTPQGDLGATLELQENAGNVTGQLVFSEGSLPIQAATFRDGRLQFEIELGGSRYRTQATVAADRMSGSWNAVYGDDNGAWSATRRVMASGEAQLLGAWIATAITPIGDMRFQLDVTKTDGKLSGTISSPEGSMPVENPSIDSNKLSFEVEYMGGRYRLELASEGDKLRGTWGAVGGGESGPLSAERK